MYVFANQIADLADLYAALQDELSRRVFWGRERADVEWLSDGAPSGESILALSALRTPWPGERPETRWDGKFLDMVRGGEKIVLYGTGRIGRSFAARMHTDSLDVYAFCGARADRYPDGLMGRPVYPPEWLADHPHVRVVVAATNTLGSSRQIMARLKAMRFPEDHVAAYVDLQRTMGPCPQYFEFPALYHGGAFADAGCYRGEDSIRFAGWIPGVTDRAKIFAFEPDPENYAEAKQNLAAAGLENVELAQAGLSDREGTAAFQMDSVAGGSRILPDSEAEARPENAQSEIRTVRLDDAVGENRVGFLKMDIEGAEHAALRGAEQTIRRDRPLLAVCVYHQPGDMTAIMQYCRELVPEYRFWLRQYDDSPFETVLYAAVPNGGAERGTR